MSQRLHDKNSWLALPGMVFFFLAYVLLGLKSMNMAAFMMAVLVPLAFFAATVLLPKLLPTDRLLLCLVNFLCGLGILVLFRLNPDRGFGQVVNYAVGLLGMVGCLMLVRFWNRLLWALPIIIVMSLVLMALPLAMGTVKNGAKAWVSLFGIGFQPSELVKVSTLLVLAYLLSRRKLLLAVIYAGFCLGLLFLQKDLGTALLYYAISLILVYVSTGSLSILSLGTLGAGAGAVVGYLMNSHVQKRVQIWQNPWQDPYGTSYQVVQSMVAMVNAGPWGTGLGLGNASRIPEVETDFIFAAVFHEFGLIFGICVVLIFLLIFLRGVAVARRARSRFHTLLALGCSCFIGIQTFVIIGGNINMIPLTGVTLPFLSYGGTSLVSSLCIMGLLQGVANANQRGLLEDQQLAMLEEELP